jgi:two-component system response regulator AtoC
MQKHGDSETQELSLSGGGELVLTVNSRGRVRTLRLPASGELTIGRSSQCDVQIDDVGVSSRHAALRLAPLAIKDLNSRNGLWLRGRRIEPDEYVELTTSDVVEIGSGFLTVRSANRPGRARRIWPHDYLEGRLDEERARHVRGGAPFALARLRVPADCNIRDVEAALARASRTEDVIARYSESDFEVLIVGAERAHAELAFERLVQSIVEATGVAREALGAGLALLGRDGTSADELITAAAAAMVGGHDSPAAPEVVPGSRLEAVLRELTRVAASELNVLVLGETGTGKELCAETVHRLSARHGKPLLRLNCAAFPADLLESELFGYERGAFTGAAAAKPGLLETAAGGTVFIDEIGDLPASTQVKLLRVLERREVQRIGALQPIAIDVRFVSATHCDLDEAIAAGRFRQDLYFRIAGYTVQVPSLRERRDEILPLARRFAERAAATAGRAAPDIDREAERMLLDYPWPGNVRELKNVVERAVVLARRGPIGREHLPTAKFASTVLTRGADARSSRDTQPLDWAVTAPLPRVDVEPGTPAPRNADELRSAHREREREAILLALEECGGNQTRAAQRLGISRGTLVAKLDAYGLPRPRKTPLPPRE